MEKKEDTKVLCIINKLKLKEVKLLSYKNETEVYSAIYISKPVILKLHENLVNYKREVTALTVLSNKDIAIPTLILCDVITLEMNTIGYIVEEYIHGEVLSHCFNQYTFKQKQKILYDIGTFLGKLNYLVSDEEAVKSELWKYAYDGVNSFREYKWVTMYIKSIPTWVNVINREESTKKMLGNSLEYYIQIIMDNLLRVSKCGDNKLIHRDYGFRNIMVYNDCISGVIDFEHAILGDSTFDLSKLIFNDIDFELDTILRNSFLNGWSDYTGQKIEWQRLWLYLAIQGLGAIQWVDKQKSYKIKEINRDYKEKGKVILRKACEHLSK